MRKIICLLIIVSIISCSGSKKENKDQPLNIENTIVFDKATNVVLERKNKKASISYYIPSSGRDKKLPVVFFFDPHAKGTLPVHAYKAFADSLNVILIGSNEMKNGMGIEQIENTLFNLLYTSFFNLPTDSTRFIFAGFSGGGRIALEKGKNLKNVSGIISCGAANEPIGLVEGRPYSVICGNEDFNYIECREVSSKFSNIISFYEFNGGHEWPSLAVMNNAIRNILSHDIIASSRKLSNQELILFAQEKNYQQELRELMGTKDLDWWKKKFDQINSQCKSADIDKSLPAKRLKNYMGMTSYYYCDFALRDNNVDLLSYCLFVYELASPNNPDMYFFATCLNCIKGNLDFAIESLSKAYELGFDDKEKVLSTPQLEILKSDNRFWSIVNSR